MRLGSQRRILRERRVEAMKIIVTFGPIIGAAIMAVYVLVLRIYVYVKELLFLYRVSLEKVTFRMERHRAE